MSAAQLSRAVVWHDLECGSYREDLALWLELAAHHGGPVLDVGAGTGRVAIALARAGHEVIALDLDRVLLAELERRAGDLPVQCLPGDGRAFSLGRKVPLCVVPMQTIQLLGGAAGRAAFLEAARRHLRPGGVLAIAIAEHLEPFVVRDGGPAPLPDLLELEGTLFCSQPTAVRLEARHFVLERRREIVDEHGRREVSDDRIELDRLSAAELEREAREAGLRPLGVREIEATVDHVASRVVILGA